MNKKINNTKPTMNAKVYVVHGNYDESGQYHEAYYKKFDFKQMPEDIHNDMLESMNRGCDFTVLIFPLLKLSSHSSRRIARISLYGTSVKVS